jgi:hypothetical protein
MPESCFARGHAERGCAIAQWSTFKPQRRSASMIDDITLGALRTRMDEHLMAVEEVLGGLDLYVQQIEGRVARIERALGIEAEGLSTQGALADLQRLSMLVAQMRRELP